jgi:hypothetical protein
MTATNPFRGMNPYLEQRWGDVRARLVAYGVDQLQERLPDELRARMQERVFIEVAGESAHGFYPDVHVSSGDRPPVSSAHPRRPVRRRRR